MPVPSMPMAYTNISMLTLCSCCLVIFTGVYCPPSTLTLLLARDAPLDIGRGGGPRVFVACKLFFYLREKTIFFFCDQRPTIFFMFRRRNFLSYALPIMYVTIWCFFWSTYFSSISTTSFFFLHTFSTNFFF